MSAHKRVGGEGQGVTHQNGEWSPDYRAILAPLS